MSRLQGWNVTMRLIYRCSVVLPILTLALLASARNASAQIVTDGTLGPAQALGGPDYQIGSNLGRIFGRNLFHSFRDFNLAQGESATFSGPASIANILSRVTGGRPSSLNGSLNSSIAGANFFFINPSGIVFGPSAQVNVGGSFVATTASLVNLPGGGVFNAENPADTVLTSAPPSSFGFLNPQPKPIIVNGALLEVGSGQSLSLLGGNVQLSGSALVAPSGQVHLVSVASAGQVAIPTGNLASTPLLSGFSKLGNLLLDGSAVDVGDASPFSSTGRGGSLSVNARNLTLQEASLLTTTNLGATSGGLIEINLDGSLQIQQESAIQAVNQGSGQGASIAVKANAINLEGPISAGPHDVTGIETVNAAGASGAGGGIVLVGKTLTLTNGARVSSNTLGAGSGGAIVVEADHVTLDGQNSSDFTGIAAQTLAAGGGQGGSIILNAGSLQVLSGAEISASSNGSGAGGDIAVNADRVTLDGRASPFFTGIIAGSFARQGGGDGGSIHINASSVRILNGAQINLDTQGNGNGGNLDITAGDVNLDGQGSLDSTGIIAQTLSGFDGGRGGSIAIDANNLRITGGAEISASSSGSGAGGDITVNAGKMVFDGQGSNPDRGDADFTGIAANTASESKSSQGGNITLHGGEIQVLNGATVTAFTTGGGKGGNIEVTADKCTLDGHNSSHFTGFSTQTTADSGGGEGGKIEVTTPKLAILDGAEISSSTFGDGAGGQIIVNADNVVLDGRGGDFSTDITAGTFALDRGGKGGSILLHTRYLQVLNGAGILADTGGSGSGGDITVRAASVLIDGQNSVTGIAADSKSTGAGGKGGDIDIRSRDLNVLRGGLISAGTLGAGDSGNIKISANNITLDRQGSALSTAVAAETGGDGRGGNIGIEAKNLRIVGGAEVSANTFGAGRGGSIVIQAGILTLDNQGSPFATTITAGTKAAASGGRGGDIEITSKHLRVVNEALISASSLGSGQGGDIKIAADDLTLNKGLITSLARGSGNAGSVLIAAKDFADIGNHSSISVTSEQSNGGDIDLSAGGAILVTNSDVNAQATGNGGQLRLHAGRILLVQDGLLSARAGGTGGNITSDAPFTIFRRSNVLASAIRGNGGNILLRAKVFLRSNESVIDASSQFGVAGNVAIDSPNTNLGGSLVVLPSNLLDAENHLATRCVVRETGASSSFSVEALNGVPAAPGDLLPSPAAR